MLAANCEPAASAKYHVPLDSELRQKFIPLTQHTLDVDLMAEQMIASLIFAVHDTTPKPCHKPRVHSCKQQPWFDSRCREALKQKEAVYKNLHCTAEQKQVALSLSD